MSINETIDLRLMKWLPCHAVDWIQVQRHDNCRSGNIRHSGLDEGLEISRGDLRVCEETATTTLDRSVEDGLGQSKLEKAICNPTLKVAEITQSPGYHCHGCAEMVKRLPIEPCLGATSHFQVEPHVRDGRSATIAVIFGEMRST